MVYVTVCAFVCLLSSSRVLWCCCANDSANEILLDTLHVHHCQRLIGQQTSVGVAAFQTPLLFKLRGLYVVVVLAEFLTN